MQNKEFPSACTATFCLAHRQPVLHILYTGCRSTLLKDAWYNSSKVVLMYHLFDQDRKWVDDLVRS